MDDSAANLTSFGVTLFETSFYVKTDVPTSKITQDDINNANQEAHNYAMMYSDISGYGACLSSVQRGVIQYNFFLAGIIGIIVAYVFIVYCFDVGLRTIKLAFLQIIAPIPCLLLMVPGQDKVFKKWIVDTLKTFFEVFMKIFIVVFCVYIIFLLRQWFDTNQAEIFPGANGVVVNFAKIFIFLGVIMFMKKAPKLIEELFGLKVEPGSFSLKKKLQESGVSAVVGGTAGLVAGAISGYKGAVEGAQARGANAKEMKWAKASGLFHGARLGGKAGASGNFNEIGSAYKYAKANIVHCHSGVQRSIWILKNQLLVTGVMFNLKCYVIILDSHLIMIV